MKLLVNAAILTLALLNAGALRAQTQEDPVLDLMVRKGLVTQAEADAAKAEETARPIAGVTRVASTLFPERTMPAKISNTCASVLPAAKITSGRPVRSSR